MNIILATRKSNLAQIQTDFVGNLINKNSNVSYEKLLVVTEGDIRFECVCIGCWKDKIEQD